MALDNEDFEDEETEEAVPYEVIVSDQHCGHNQPLIAVYYTLNAWCEHWQLEHTWSRIQACPEPDLSARMLVEVAGGSTWTGMSRLEVTEVTVRQDSLLVQATLTYPRGLHTRDVGFPFIVLATPPVDGPVLLDMSVLHGVRRHARPTRREPSP